MVVRRAPRPEQATHPLALRVPPRDAGSASVGFRGFAATGAARCRPRRSPRSPWGCGARPASTPASPLHVASPTTVRRSVVARPAANRPPGVPRRRLRAAMCARVRGDRSHGLDQRFVVQVLAAAYSGQRQGRVGACRSEGRVTLVLGGDHLADRRRKRLFELGLVGPRQAVALRPIRLLTICPGAGRGWHGLSGDRGGLAYARRAIVTQPLPVDAGVGLAQGSGDDLTPKV
jgi:hypothetical protein